MLTKIKVYGRLKKLLGWKDGVYFADVHSAAEVGKFLIANWPHLKKHIASQFYSIKCDGFAIGHEELNYPIGREITIVPVVAGTLNLKNLFKSKWTRIIIGVALIVAAPQFAGMYVGTFGITSAIAVSSIVAGVGLSLALSGVAGLLAPDEPVPSAGSEMDPQSNYSFSGIQNVSRAGVPLKICYGYEIFSGSVTISNQIDTVQVDGTA
jgi:predicted phage tail protein